MLQKGVGCTTTMSTIGAGSRGEARVGIRLSALLFAYQLCQKLCQPLCQPPLPQPPLPQPPLPQLCQPPLPQPPLRQPRCQRPQPPLPHQAGSALAPPSAGSLAEPVISEIPIRISCKRVDTLSPLGGVRLL